MQKLLMTALTLALVVTGATVVSAAVGGDSTRTTTTTTTTTTEAIEDVSGNCDEAEHASDPACGGAGIVDGHDEDRGHDEFEDSSGPSINSGPGSVDDDDEGEFDDSSGPGSGTEDGDDNSGPGGGDD